MAKSEIMTMPARRRLSPLIWPSLGVAIVFAILVGLGLWQLERLAWKQKLLADMQERLQADPVALPDPRDWPMLTQDKDEFRRVRLRASFPHAPRAYIYAGAPALRTDLVSPGYFVFAPAHLASGEMIVVNLGWLPLDRIHEGNAPNGEITGYLRWPEKGSPFIADHDEAGQIWFARDPHAMAALRVFEELPVQAHAPPSAATAAIDSSAAP